MTRVGTPRRVGTPWRVVTPRRVVTSLCLIFSLIDPSKEGCADLLKLNKWNGADLIRTIPLILAQNKDPNDLLHCTLQQLPSVVRDKENHSLECNITMNDKLCHVLRECFEPGKKTTCEGSSSRNISFYHLMCLVAKLQNYPPDGVAPEGCEYENVCELYPQISADQTTTTITESTTATSPTTVLSPTTTPPPSPTPAPTPTPATPPTPAPPPSPTPTPTPAPAPPPSPTPPPTPAPPPSPTPPPTPTPTPSPPPTPTPTPTPSPPPTSTPEPPPPPPPPPGTTTVKHDGGNANSSTGTRDASNMLYKYLFIFSGTLNIVLLVAVFFCKRRCTQHRTQNHTHQDESTVLNETCDDPDPLPLMPIITKPDCPLVDSPSADTTRNRCTAGNGLQSH